jgi:type VI secretion system protein ImpJ
MHSRVLWKNGTFLTPQHFQQADRHLSTLLRPIGPLDWGIVSLEFDSAGLAEGRLGLRRCRAVLGDGTPVDFGRDARSNRDGDDPVPPAIAFELTSGQPRISVWLTLPERVSDGRYREEGCELSDDYNPGNRRSVTVGHKNLRLAVTGQPLTGHIALKLAEIESDSGGVPVLSKDYVPPCRTLAASPFFGQLIERLLVRLERRLRDRAKFRDRIEETLVIQHIVAALPVLRHLQQTSVQESTHPQVLFAELLRLAGGLSLLAKDPPALPLYAHEDAAGCFKELDQQIALLLGAVTPSQVDVFTLRVRAGFEDNVIWDTTVPRNRPLPGEQLYLILSGDFEFQRIVEELPRRGKLGGPKAVESALANGWPGLRLLPEPPPEALRTRGRGAVSAFFRLPTADYPKRKTGVQEIDRAVDLWSEVHEQGLVSLYIPEDLLRRPLPQIDLIYLREGKTP